MELLKIKRSVLVWIGVYSKEWIILGVNFLAGVDLLTHSKNPGPEDPALFYRPLCLAGLPQKGVLVLFSACGGYDYKKVYGLRFTVYGKKI